MKHRISFSPISLMVTFGTFFITLSIHAAANQKNEGLVERYGIGSEVVFVQRNGVTTITALCSNGKYNATKTTDFGWASPSTKQLESADHHFKKLEKKYKKQEEIKNAKDHFANQSANVKGSD